MAESGMHHRQIGRLQHEHEIGYNKYTGFFIKHEDAVS